MEQKTETIEVDCAARFYDTSYGISYFQRPGNHFSPLAKPIPEIDPNLAPGHCFNNLQLRGNPIPSRTWPKHEIDKCPEEYEEYLKTLKVQKKDLYAKYYTDPEVDVRPLLAADKDAKLTTYESDYSPEDYVSKKEGLKWPRSNLDTSRYKYHETTYRTYNNRVEEIEEMRPLSKPFTWQHDVEQLKSELRKIYRTTKTTYYTHICEIRIPKMKQLLKEGKVWVDPLDAYTLRRV